MTTRLRAFAVAGLLLAAACAGAGTTRPNPASGPVTGPDHPVRIEARRVPLGVGGATLAPGVRYAGGLALYGAKLHGLSDLKLDGDRAWAVSDFGDLVRFTIRLDTSGRLVGATNAVSRALLDADGLPLTPKRRADAEGLARLDDGRLLVSFEGDDRIWAYGPDGDGPPTPLRRPDVPFPENAGMEGLSVAPGGWLVLGESGGAWVCDAAACRVLPAAPAPPDDGFRFTSADRDSAGGWFVVERFYAPPLDLRVRVRRMAGDGALGPVLIALRPPASVDNFEGLAVQATPHGARLYLLSDDNAFPLEKTLLLAFDVPNA